MIPKPDAIKRYSSAKCRFLKPLIVNFFATEFPKLFGPVMCDKIADELISLFENTCPETSRLKPGQMLWVALDKHTRGDSPHKKLVPVVLSLVTEQDIQSLEEGTLQKIISEEAITRMIREAYGQGGILSMRDIGLITLRNSSNVSNLRMNYERKHQCVLPHTGVLHDMGSSITHKALILHKIVIEKKDPATTARETNHSQRAVDRYLKDYNRVKTIYQKNTDLAFIHIVTGLAKHVVSQYIGIINNEI